MTMNWVKDTAERLAKTFVQAFLAQITASGLGLFDLVKDTSTVQRAAMAGVAAAYSLIFSFVSTWANRGTKRTSEVLSPASLAS